MSEATQKLDLLRDPLPWLKGKRFREASLVEQNELIVRLIEETLDEVRALRSDLERRPGR